ncbi:sulfatase-like hydrolase/transferase [Pseudocolwellia sp. AS88]|uniref:sulfatase-like hydrolase/transferase n=1 Tax=Pseudocolwellia sp. AS88 TaxID=3063958 RepID=UPI0026F17E91|nr:sulfatase-like hydrolase/transferase [Pseudocolwellia sp. AS88]MDO7085578.1 sulfatase-like hydrolase/transferase [Pseudocolwellia sp. AS88]
MSKKYIFGVFLFAYHLVGFTAEPTSKPNIIVVMADDMGWGDSATYGNKTIKTPNLDKLAKQGVKFTQGYSSAGVCSPARSSILTGRTPYRNGVWRHLSGNGETHLRTSEITYPTLFKKAGYTTGHFGKWHLLSKNQFNKEGFPHPDSHGFDYWFATQNNAIPSHKNPNNFIRNHKPVGELKGYSAPLVADEAINWIEEGRDKTKPFIMSVWFHEPHKPIATDIKFSELYPNETKKNKTYFGNISQMDHALGKIMKVLDEQSLSENTLIMFTSDNGPVVSVGGDSGGLRGFKRNDFEGGIRVPFLVRWPGHITADTENDTPIIGTDIFTTILNVAGIEVPKDRTIDGVNFLPALDGQKLKRTTPLFWRTHVSPAEDRVAMRIDDWKIVGNDTLTEFMLFNVQKDWQEQNDLAKTMPEKLNSMKAKLLETWADIKSEGPNQWWEAETQPPMKGSKLNY